VKGGDYVTARCVKGGDYVTARCVKGGDYVTARCVKGGDYVTARCNVTHIIKKKFTNFCTRFTVIIGCATPKIFKIDLCDGSRAEGFCTFE
jgi:hypothetical protein